MKKLHIKRGDTVIVLSGDDKGKSGKILQVLKEKERVLVEGVNMVSKSTKPSSKQPQGGIITKEAPIHISNVSLIDPKTGKATRIGIQKDENGVKLRVSKKTGEVIK